MNFFLESATTLETVVTGLDLSGFAGTYLIVAGVALPVIISVMVIKKGIAWVRGFIKRV